MTDTSNIRGEIGSAIRSRRRTLGLSQQDVADLIGVQRQTVGRIESGGDTDFSTLVRLGAAVGLEFQVAPRYEDGRS